MQLKEVVCARNNEEKVKPVFRLSGLWAVVRKEGLTCCWMSRSRSKTGERREECGEERYSIVQA